VEHDAETIERAEHIIDMGPGAGARGGQIVAEGRLTDLMNDPRSVTGQALARPLHHPLRGARRPCRDAAILQVRQAELHNLKQLNLSLPLNRLVCVTGVSGSGKSSLIREVLVRSLEALHAARHHRRSSALPSVALHGCASVQNWELIGRVLEVDQSPIGKTPRSCPATFVGIWDAVRQLYAAVPEAKLRGYTPGRFSFNTPLGRCAGCEGQGLKRIEMSFLPDVKIPCEVCGGARFDQETLDIEYKGKHIGEILQLPVDDAVEFFAAHPAMHQTLAMMQQMGLGYLTLGQHSPTLSGGEAQRIKLVAELAKAKPVTAPQRGHQPTLYVLDEPTVGLHLADVEKLIQVLHRLVDAGHSVVVVEHNLDVIAEADWVIDLGPEGGAAGGSIVANGTPEDLINAAARSHTGQALKRVLLS
jgi:excinuclease ABC subunit A